MTLALLLAVSTCHGQVPKVPFPDSGAVFTYLFIYGWGNLYSGDPFHYRHVRDTTIFDNRLEVARNVMILEGDGPAKGTYRYLVKDSNNVVWFCFVDTGATCHEWFNFNKGVGDQNFRGTISSMDLITNQGITRRRMHIGYGTSIIEGIGPTDGWPIPIRRNEMITRIALLCFSVGDSVTYVNPEYGTCDTSWHIDLSISELPFPNQMVSLIGNQVLVESLANLSQRDLKIQVFALDGKAVLTKSLNTAKTQFPLMAGQGVYMYVLSGSDQVLERGKLLLR